MQPQGTNTWRREEERGGQVGWQLGNGFDFPSESVRGNWLASDCDLLGWSLWSGGLGSRWPLGGFGCQCGFLARYGTPNVLVSIPWGRGGDAVCRTSRYSRASEVWSKRSSRREDAEATERAREAEISWEFTRTMLKRHSRTVICYITRFSYLGSRHLL